MKFHRIDVENINSLYGENPIDLDGHFSDTPLYLIMGPTGSGKTTILDAVCLALFGTTPRQAAENSAAADVGAQVNSQGTGRSRAEVVFSLLDPKQGVRTRYRAVWEFWRAHDHADGRPQKPRRELHQLDDDGEWSVLVSSTKEKDFRDPFDHVLDGMSLNDFLRSVMLAQGEFSALLKAEDADKASILERLTDTGDYQKLGWLAHQRWQKEKKELERLDEQVGNFDGATPDEIAATEQELDEKKQDCQALGQWQDAAATRRKWLERFEQLSGELAEAKEAHKDAKAKREECAEDFARRDADREASKARAPRDEVRRLQADQQELVKSLPELEKTQKERDEALEEARKKEAAAKEALDAAEKAFEELKPEIKAAKEIKNDLKNTRKEVEALDDKIEGQEEKLEKTQDTFEKSGEKLEEAQQAQKTAADKLEAIADDEALAQKTPALRAELDALQKENERVVRASGKVDELDEELSEKSEEKEKLDKRLADQKTALEPL
ncbi:MAG: AAA family ATPase, partial [Persicimonas sp.]